MDEVERLARLEEWRKMHSVEAVKRGEKNDLDHKMILSRLSDLEVSLLVYRRVVYFTGSFIGMTVGLIIHYWDFIVNRVGH